MGWAVDYETTEAGSASVSPISFLGAVALMFGLDVSVNGLSLFGIVLVLGIVVDDAISRGEEHRTV